MPTTYAIPDGRTVMAATTFDGITGGGTVLNAVNGVSFQPDMVWMKARNNANNHELADSVRGTAYGLFPNLTNAEVSDTRVSAFNSNGFSYGTNSNSASTGRTVVGWQWKAGGTATTIAIGSISSGVPSIASSVSANTAAGFSVVTYTGNATSGATVGHGLGVVPNMIILKSRTLGTNWYVYHSSLSSALYQIYLNFALAQDDTGITALNDKAPTNTVFELPGTGYGSNNSAATYVAYCFTAVAGYSAFGSYTGNNLDNGPFVYLGFRPRFIMIKRSDAASDWFILDSSRDTYNVEYSTLAPNQALAESSYGTNNLVDFLSNGFKIRRDNNYGYMNASGGTYIYACFAENPFKYSNAR